MEREHHLFIVSAVFLAAILFLTLLTRCSAPQEETRIITKHSHGASAEFDEEVKPVIIDDYNESE